MRRVLEDLIPVFDYLSLDYQAKLIQRHRLFQSAEFFSVLVIGWDKNKIEKFVDKIGKVKGLTFELRKDCIIIEDDHNICNYKYNPIDRLLEKVNK